MAKKVRDIEAEIDLVKTPEQASLTLDRIGTVKRAGARKKLTDKLNSQFDNSVVSFVDANKKTIESNLENIEKKRNEEIKKERDNQFDTADSQFMKGVNNQLDMKGYPNNENKENPIEVKTGNALKDALNKSIETPNIDMTNIGGDFINTGDGIKSATQEYIQKDLLNATTPEEAKQVVTFGMDVVKPTILDAEKQIKSQDIINATAYDPNRQPQITTNDVDMGLFSTTKGMTPEQIQAMQGQFNKSVLDKKMNAVEPAIEALGLQDYFPSIGYNIKAGGYSGKVIGNVDIFVAGGGQLPFALRDARKRAMEKDAQAKAVQADKIKQLNFDTVPQYQAQYSDLAMKFIDDNLKLANYDANELYNGKTELSRKFKEGLVKFENVDKEVTYVDEVAKKVYTDLKAGKYVSPEAVELLTQWQEGKLNLEDFISDGGKFPSLIEKMKSYANIDEYTNKMADQIKETGLTVRPLDNNKMTTDSNYITKANDAFKLKKGNGYDTYMSTIGTYFDVEKARGLIDSVWEDGDFYRGESKQEEQIQKAKFAETFLSKIGSKVEVKMDNVANDDLERSRLSFDQRKYDESKPEQYYQDVDQFTQDAGTKAEKRIALRESQLGQNLTPAQKRYVYNEEFVNAGLSPEQKDRGFATFKISKTTSKEGVSKPYTMSTTAEDYFIDIVDNSGKKIKVPISDLNNYKGAKLASTGKQITAEQYKEAQQATKQGSFAIEGKNQYGFYAKYNPSSKQMIPAEYANFEGERTTMVGTEGGFMYTDGSIGTDGKPKMKKSTLIGTMYINNSKSDGQAQLGVGGVGQSTELKKIED